MKSPEYYKIWKNFCTITSYTFVTSICWKKILNRLSLNKRIRTMLDIYRESWAKNWGFSPLSDGEAEHHVKELKGILDPEFFVLFFHNDEPAAGMVALPDKEIYKNFILF